MRDTIHEIRATIFSFRIKSFKVNRFKLVINIENGRDHAGRFWI